MKRLNYLVILGALAALILAMVAIVPASADRPDHNMAIWEADWNSYMCGAGIPIPTHLEGKFVNIYFYDRYGGDRADTYHYGGTTVTYTYDDRTLTLHDSENYHWDWIDWYDAIVEIKGASYIGTIPGHGVVWGTVGKQVWLEHCYDAWDENGNWYWKCDYSLQDVSGVVFSDLGTVCNYLLNGE
jgi:hypothetical protein